MPTFEINLIGFVILIVLSCVGALVLLILAGVWLLLLFERILAYFEERKDEKEQDREE